MKLLQVRTALSRRVGPSPGTRGEAIFAPRVTQEAALALSVVVLVGVARATPPPTGLHAAVAWLAALTFCGAFLLSTVRPLVVAMVLCGLCSVVLEIVHPSTTAFIMAIVALMQASRFPAPLGPTLAVLAGLGYVAAMAATVHAIDPGALLSSASGLVFAYLATSSYRRLREEKRTTERLLSEVLAGRDAQIRAAALDERARLAREIHDILAHTLSALAVQLEGTRLLVERRPGDPAALAALERAGSLVRDGLVETRRAVGALRGEVLPGPEALPRLVAAFERDTGMPCRLIVEGAPVALAPEASLALYRTAQEALTNVRKHAAASSVAIHLRFATDGTELTIENDGHPPQEAPRRPPPGPLPGGGHGLQGMRERAELAHGRLDAGPTPVGFRVHLWLPA